MNLLQWESLSVFLELHACLYKYSGKDSPVAHDLLLPRGVGMCVRFTVNFLSTSGPC